MQIRSWNSELMIANILFARLFRNFRITRSLDKDNKERRTIQVPCVIGNRSRIFKSAENWVGNGTAQFPIVVVTRGNITIVPDRIVNLHNEKTKATTPSRIDYNLYSPTPIDIEYTVTLASKWPNDIDMMLGQILPYFNKDVFVSSRHPKFFNILYDSQVVIGDSISFETNTDLSNDADDLTIATLNFTYKTAIFGGTDQVRLSPSGAGGYIAPVTKIFAELHAANTTSEEYRKAVGVPEEQWRWGWNTSGVETEDTSGNKPPYESLSDYFEKLENGEIRYPEYDTLNWIIGQNEDGSTIVDPNIPYGYTPIMGDGLVEVPIYGYDKNGNPLYVPQCDKMVDETNIDNYDLLSIQNKQMSTYTEPYVKPYFKEDGSDFNPPTDTTTDEMYNSGNDNLI